MADRRPRIYLLAGPNGAGKTTFYEQKLRPRIRAEFINADEVEKQRWPTEQGRHSYEAARLAEERRRELMAQGKSFITETTFSHPSKVQLVEDARRAGYRVELLHIHVRSANISVDRVAGRVRKGGHDVPEEKTRGRHERNQAFIREAAGKVDRTEVYDNSIRYRPHQWVMSLEGERAVAISNKVPKWARELYAEQLKAFSQSRQNAAAQSFQEARALVSALIGDHAQTRIARRGQEYQGTIIAESSLHTLQAVSERMVVAHFSEGLASAPQIGDRVTIAYARDRHRAHVRETGHEPSSRDGSELER